MKRRKFLVKGLEGALVTMMLDNLSKQYKLSVSKKAIR